MSRRKFFALLAPMLAAKTDPMRSANVATYSLTGYVIRGPVVLPYRTGYVIRGPVESFHGTYVPGRFIPS